MFFLNNLKGNNPAIAMEWRFEKETSRETFYDFLKAYMEFYVKIFGEVIQPKGSKFLKEWIIHMKNII